MSKIERTRRQKWLRFFLIKVPIIIAVLIVLMIISLKLVERYPDPLRQGFEKYLSGAYGTNATIGKLEEITFFPEMNIQASDITMHSTSNAAIIDMEIKSVKMHAPFWSKMLNTGRFDYLRIEGLSAVKGFITPFALSVDSVSIVEETGEQFGTFIKANGTYNDQVMTFEAAIKKLEKGYKIQKQTSFSIAIGDTVLNATMVQKLSTVTLENAILSYDGISGVARNYDLFKGKTFQKDNPLYCIVHQNVINECKEYLEN